MQISMYKLSEKVLNKLFGKVFQMKLPPTDLSNWGRFRHLEATFVLLFFFFYGATYTFFIHQSMQSLILWRKGYLRVKMFNLKDLSMFILWD